MTPSLLGVVLAGLTIVTNLAQAKCSNDLKPGYDRPVPAEGWSYRLIANGLTTPRGIRFDSQGALLVVEEGARITRVVLQDDGGTCLSAKSNNAVVEDTSVAHGIEISPDGRTLYASTDNDVWSWAYDPSTGTVDAGSKKTLITNMTNTGHTSRTLLLSKSQPGWLIVSRGSQGNDDPLAEVQASGHSQIRAFDISENRDTPYNFPTDGRMLGWGLRNSVGLAEHPVTHGIWSVENSVDNLQRNGIDIHVDNPGEELNYHGTLTDTANQGGNYGYPVCYALWGTEAPFPNIGNLTTGDNFAPDRTANRPTTNDTACNTQYVPPELTFQAHTAPLDIVFDQDGANALVSFHGSWNRPDPVGYSVNIVAWNRESGRPAAARDSKDAAQPVLSNRDMSKCPNGCFRPVGLAWGTNGRLFFSSDKTGEIFVLSHDGGGDSAGVRLGAPWTSGLLALGVMLGWLL